MEPTTHGRHRGTDFSCRTTPKALSNVTSRVSTETPLGYLSTHLPKLRNLDAEIRHKMLNTPPLTCTLTTFLAPTNATYIFVLGFGAFLKFKYCSPCLPPN